MSNCILTARINKNNERQQCTKSWYAFYFDNLELYNCTAQFRSCELGFDFSPLICFKPTKNKNKLNDFYGSFTNVIIRILTRNPQRERHLQCKPDQRRKDPTWGPGSSGFTGRVKEVIIPPRPLKIQVSFLILYRYTCKPSQFYSNLFFTSPKFKDDYQEFK